MPTVPPQLPNGTLLLITPVSAVTPTLTPYSARGLTQTLELLSGSGGISGGSWLKRDVNGNLRDVSDTRFRKYRSKISCRDGETVCLDGAWIGTEVVVSCCVELSYPTGASAQRSQVPGSSRVQGAITYYRPLLTMLVTAIMNSFQEYGAVNAWEVTLEEI